MPLKRPLAPSERMLVGYKDVFQKLWLATSPARVFPIARLWGHNESRLCYKTMVCHLVQSHRMRGMKWLFELLRQCLDCLVEHRQARWGLLSLEGHALMLYSGPMASQWLLVPSLFVPSLSMTYGNLHKRRLSWSLPTVVRSFSWLADLRSR